MQIEPYTRGEQMLTKLIFKRTEGKYGLASIGDTHLSGRDSCGVYEFVPYGYWSLNSNKLICRYDVLISKHPKDIFIVVKEF